MVFGFGRKGDDEPDDDDEEPIELILFQGAFNGNEANLAANARLVQAGLMRAKQLVSDGISRRAEMIVLEPKGKASISRYFVDGVAYPGERMPVQAGLAITQMLKLLAGLDIQVRDKPQSGGIKAEHEEKPYLLRVDVQPVQGGERLIVRAQNADAILNTPQELGFSDELREKLRDWTNQHQGVVLAAGPPMSGVTTTAFALVRGVDAYLYTVYNLTEVEEGRDLGHISTFEGREGDDTREAYNRAVRAEADVLYVEPIRDAEHCRIVFDEADDVCFVAEAKSKNIRDAATGVVQVVQWLGDPQLVAERLHAVVSQKLVRLLCRKCRQAYRPNPKLLHRVGLPPETKVLYRPPVPGEEGEEDFCEQCGGIGYFGRTGLIEVIEMTEGMKSIVAKGGDLAAIKQQARTEKMQTFQSDGLRLVAEGKTSLEELQRAFRSK